MTPVLRNLHWLQIRHRIKFKTAVLVYKCLHGMAPPYLASYYTVALLYMALYSLEQFAS